MCSKILTGNDFCAENRTCLPSEVRNCIFICRCSDICEFINISAGLETEMPDRFKRAGLVKQA